MIYIIDFVSLKLSTPNYKLKKKIKNKNDSLGIMISIFFMHSLKKIINSLKRLYKYLLANFSFKK